MQVHISQIHPSTGFLVEESLALTDVEALVSEFEDHHAVSELAVRIRLSTLAQGVLARGTITGTVAGPCSRCLEPIEYPIESELLVTFVAGGAQSFTDGEETDLTADELDVFHYEGDVIELDELVRESVILELQPFPQCREERPELCAEYANHVAKIADETVVDDRGDEGGEEHVDPRWAALLALKNKTNQTEN